MGGQSSDSEEEDMSSYGLSMVSIAGPSKHDCGYCKGTDTSISFGIWAHSMTCPVSHLSKMRNIFPFYLLFFL